MQDLAARLDISVLGHGERINRAGEGSAYIRLRDYLVGGGNGCLRLGYARVGARKIGRRIGFCLLFLERLQRGGCDLQPRLCLGFLAGSRGPFGLQLFDDVKIPGGLVVIELRFGDIAGKGEQLLMCAAALNALVAGFGCAQRTAPLRPIPGSDPL